MSALHAWHRDTFSKMTEVTLHPKHYSGMFGGTFPQGPDGQPLGPTTRLMKNARTVVCQRVVNGLSPEEWQHAQTAFDASSEGKALESTDAGVRRDHCEVWLLHRLYTAEHPELVPETEYALNFLLEVHAAPEKLKAHRARIIAHVKDGEPLSHVPEVAS